MMNIIGSGGGGGGSQSQSQPQQRAAVVSPDSLTSKQFAKVLDLVSEGEIEGLVNGNKSIYLDGTPLENSDGSINFPGFTVDMRNGSAAQDYIAGFPASESASSVSVEVKNGVPVVRMVSNTNANALRISVAVPQLYTQTPSTGDVGGASISLTIEVQPNLGTYTEVKSDVISGKCTSRYSRNYVFNLPGSGPWNVRITKTSPDSDANTRRDLYWDATTEIIDAKLRYPNSALVGITVDSSQFSSIPSRAYDLKGLRVKIPSNYNPVTRVYTGIWDGTFTVAWTDNPAWCFYDLLTNPRYGLGEFVTPAQVDKANLYTIGKYCDELVPDGFGGMEPRFACNLYLQTREDAFRVLSDMVSIFAGMLFWASGGLSCTQDAPDDAIYQFTNGNVIDGSFSYAGSSRNVRHTTALVSYNDPNDKFTRKVEYVEDTEGLIRWGLRQAETVAIGCTSRGQAHRLGKRILLSERFLTEVVTFKTGLEGTVPYPGAVIRIMDNARAGARMGGRVRSATTTSVELDAPVTLTGGVSYTLTIIKPDGSIEERGIVGHSGDLQTLTPTIAFSNAANAQSVWVLTSSELDAQLFKVVGVKESDGFIYEVTALQYNPAKYAAIEQNLMFEPLSTSLFESAAVQMPPTNLAISESLYQSSIATVDGLMTISWDAPVADQWIAYYRVMWRVENGNWNFLPDQQTTTAVVSPVLPGGVDVRVTAVNQIGVQSLPAVASTVLLGKTAPPVAVTGFSVIKTNGVAIVSWDSHADLDVRVGGRIVVRHTPDTTGATWANSYILESFDGNTVSGICPLMTGTYFAKALDSSGNWSMDAASFVATEGMVTGFVTVASAVEAPVFSGTKSGVINTGSAIQIEPAALVDDLTDPVDGWNSMDALGGIQSSGEYAFFNQLDLGSVATRRFVADIKTASFDVDDWIDFRSQPLDEWPDMDGLIINDCDLYLYAMTTNDDPSGSPVWSEWTPFFVADFTCRAIRFKCVLLSGAINHNISVPRLTVLAKIPA